MRFSSILIILIFVSFGATAQVYQNMAQPGYKFGRARFDSVLTIPTGLGAMRNITGGQDTGQIRFNVSDSSVYVWNGRRWVKPVGGGISDTLKVSVSDTAAMLANYAKTAALALKVNISDTAAMLSPYVRAASLTIPTLTQVLEAAPGSNEAGANQIKDLSAGTSQNDAATFGQLTDTANLRLRISDTSAMLSRYLDTLQAHNTRIISAGGGGGSDSSWVSTETGIAPNMLGYLVNSTLGSLPSGWADNTPNATVTFSSKMIVSGGTTGTSLFNANTGTSTVYSNRIDMDFYPYSKMRYAFTVVPQDKTASSDGLALHFQANSLFFSSAMRIRFNLTNTADSGKITMDYNFGSAVATSANLSHASGDTLDIEIIKDFWLITAKWRNRRTGKYVDCKYYSYGSSFGTGGKAYLGLLGGSQHILSAKVESYDLKNGAAITFIGDSQTAGSGATSEEKIFPLQVMRGSKLKTSNISNGSLTLSAAVLSHVPAAIALNNPVIITLGYNDRRDLSTDTTTFKTRLAAVVNPLVAAGVPIYGIATIVPTNASNANFNNAIRNYCAANGYTVINIDSAIRNTTTDTRIKPNYLGNDAVHWSDSGQVVGANKVLSTIGTLIQPFFKDTVSAVVFNDLPQGEENMNRLVVDNNGKVKQVPATTFDVIFNARSYNGAGTIAQPAEVHVNGAIKTDSALFVHNRNGLYLGFNGGTLYDTTSVGSNIIITNAGVGGIGIPQRFGTFASNGQNILMQQLSVRPTKSGATPANISGSQNYIHTYSSVNISGSSNYVTQSARGLALTSGSNNSLNGLEGGGSFTTGNYNYSWTNLLNYNGVSNTPAWAANNAIGTMMWGTPYDFNGGTLMQNGEVLIASYTRGDRLYTFGPRGAFSGTKNTWWAGHQAGTNLNGLPLYIQPMAQTGNGVTGKIILQSFNGGGASGTTVATSTSDELEVDNKKVLIPNRFQTSTGANVASANDLTLGNDGNVFTITGTTQINAITTTNWQAGSEIILIFNASVTVKNNTAGGANTALMLLAGGVDFSATSNDVLKLVYNGTSWFEVSRSVN